MPDDLATLEIERSEILEKFLGLRDLRPGSITTVIRRCGVMRRGRCPRRFHDDLRLVSQIPGGVAR